MGGMRWVGRQEGGRRVCQPSPTTPPVVTQGSYLCETCADGYYAFGDNTCAACPKAASFIARYRGLFIVVFVILGLLLLVYGLLGGLWGGGSGKQAGVWRRR